MVTNVLFVYYAMKYLHWEAAPTYINIPALTQLRALATQLQKQGDYERSQSGEDLTQLGKVAGLVHETSFLKVQCSSEYSTPKHVVTSFLCFVFVCLFVCLFCSKA